MYTFIMLTYQEYILLCTTHSVLYIFNALQGLFVSLAAVKHSKDMIDILYICPTLEHVLNIKILYETTEWVASAYMVLSARFKPRTIQS